MKSQPGLTIGNITSRHARNRLFARLRETAFPTERPAAMANRENVESFGAAINTINGLAKEFPVRFTRRKSVERVKQNFRFTHLPILFFNQA
jgi:hypothetical protein